MSLPEKEPQGSPLLSNLFDDFLAKNQPAENFEKAAEKITTLDLLERLQAHYPFADLTSEALYNMLTTNGFKYSGLGDKYVWLINSK